MQKRKRDLALLLAAVLTAGILTPEGTAGVWARELSEETETEVQANSAQAGTGAAADTEAETEPETSAAKKKKKKEQMVPARKIDFESLWEENEDIYSWIELPGTVIDYPVLQSAEDEEYYLHRNVQKEEDVYGSIFTQEYNRKDYTDFLTVVYGHNMRDGTMFGSLGMYREEGGMEDHKYIYVYLPEIVLEYEVFAAYSIDAIHLLYKFDQEDPKDRREYLQEIAEKSETAYAFDQELFDTMSEDSHILVLHTCIGDPNYRFLVQAVLNEEYYDWDEKAVELGLREPETEPETETLLYETDTQEETETQESQKM